MGKSKKRMSLKEFKHIFELAYGEDAFDDYGFEYILNNLSSHEYQNAKTEIEFGFDRLAQESMKRSHIIYDELVRIKKEIS